MTTPAFRRVTSLAALQAGVAASGLAQAAPAEWPHRKVGRGQATLASGYPMPGGRPAALAVKLVREGGQWRVEGVSIGPDVGTQLRRFYPVDAERLGFRLAAGGLETPPPAPPR